MMTTVLTNYSLKRVVEALKESIFNFKNDSLDGRIWIKDGTVYVRDNQDQGIPALINPTEGIDIMINGLKYNHLISVNSTDNIKLVPVEMVKIGIADVEVDDEKITAYFNYKPEQKIKRMALDCEPVNKLDIKYKDVISEEKKITREEIGEILEKNGVTYGIKEDVIESIVLFNKSGKYLIAEGKKAIEPTDEKIEYFFDDTLNKEVKMSENSLENVDFKNSVEYKTVKPGEIIAKIYGLVEGIKGIKVNGETIEVRDAENIVVSGKSIFVETCGDISIVRAKSEGKPSKKVLDGIVHFEIMDLLSVDEVSIKSGNIKYNGIVRVIGDVNENMEIIAKGEVDVRGSVSFANIKAMDNISIKYGVVSSKIEVVELLTDFIDHNLLVTNIKNELESVLNEVDLIYKTKKIAVDSEFYKNAISFVITKKKFDLFSTIYEFITGLRNGQQGIDERFLSDIVRRLNTILAKNFECVDRNFIIRLIGDMSQLSTIKMNTSQTGNVYVNTIINSEVSTMGSIFITGKTCLNSYLNAKKDVIVNGNFRGGEIKAGQKITVDKTGSEMGIKTLLSVPENGSIFIKHACTDTFVKIGKCTHLFLDEAKMVNMKLVNGKIKMF